MAGSNVTAVTYGKNIMSKTGEIPQNGGIVGQPTGQFGKSIGQNGSANLKFLDLL